MASEDNEIVVHEERIPSCTTAETLTTMDEMYSLIGRTIQALSTTTVDGVSDGEGDLDSDIQAHSTKGLLPDTELEMLRSGAIPMSEADVMAFNLLKERKSSVQFRNEQAKIPSMTLAEISGARIKVAYRLTRFMAHVRGIGKMGQPLVFVLGAANSQLNLYELPIIYDPTAGLYRGMGAVRKLLDTANRGPYTYSYDIDGEQYTAKGMSILPPPIHDGYFPNTGPPSDFRRTGYTPPDYQANTDVPLAIYLNICELLVHYLGIGDDDIQEQAAVQALLNPKIARLAWPCRDDLETFEEAVLLPYVGSIFAKKAQDSTIDFLMKGETNHKGVVTVKGMGLTHAEAFDILETYKTYAQQVNVFDPEKERSPILSKLQRLAEECNGAGMVTTELNTYKAYLQILGLTKHDEDTNIDKRAALGSVLEAKVLEGRKNEVKQLQTEDD